MHTKTYWWKDRAWRIVQTNMREIDMADMDAQRYVKDLQSFNANTVLINTGGIVANYDTKFPFHFKNQYLTGDSLETVMKACREAGIRVICRVDFSKVRTPIYENHPDWAYVSPKGNIIDYHGNIHMCFNSEYQQKHAISIMREIITDLDPDGIFMNMGGYAVGYDYTYGWQGICQCSNCRQRFFDMYGEELPTEENPDDPVYQHYRLFQKKTLAEYYDNIRRMIAETKPELLFFHTDMLRGEAGTWIQSPEQNYLYKASELLRVEKYSHPEKVSSVTSVDFIDMIYRFSAVSGRQQELRIAQTLANGGFADYYMMGRLDNAPDKSAVSALQRMFQYHKDHEEDYHATISAARIALVKPSLGFFDVFKANPNEYFGWYYLMTQQHYLFDCIEADALESVPLDKYHTIILPDIQDLSDSTAALLDRFVEQGGTLIASGETALHDEQHRRQRNMRLKSLGVERVGYIGRGILSAYFQIENKELFPRLSASEYVYLHGTYCYTDAAEGVTKYMKLIPPHFHSPPESAYPTNITDYAAFTVCDYGKGRGVYVPWKPGNEYYHLGFPHMECFMADLLEHVLKVEKVMGNLPPMVEITHTVREQTGAQYVHLVNDSGYFCNSYFDPLPLQHLVVELPWEGPAPTSATSMVTGKACRFEVLEGAIRLSVDELHLFEAIKLV